MSVLHTAKERFDNLLRKIWTKRSTQKNPSRKLGKNKKLLQMTIPSRRGTRKKSLQSMSSIENTV